LIKPLSLAPDAAADLDAPVFFDPTQFFAPIPGFAPADQAHTTPANPAQPDATVVGYGDLGVISSASRGSNGTTTATTSGTAPAPTLVTTAGSNLAIDLVWDSSVASAPTGFMTDIENAAAFIESHLSTTATIYMNVGYNEVGGSSLSSGALGESESYLTSVSYASLVAALKATASTDATDAAMLASLPATSPVSGTFWLTTAQAKALGLISATNSSTDGDIGFGVSSEFTYGDTNTTGSVASGTYDFFATAAHEISEVMGRLLLVGTTAINGSAAYSLLDLAHYSAAGTRDFSQSTAGYFSVNGGTTNLGNYNTISGGDAGDWASSVSNDAFDAYANPGVLEQVSTNDFAELDAMGWNLTGSVAAPPAPTGVSIASVATTSLNALQGSSGLAGGVAIATFAQTGGVAGDTFTYTLGGTGASSFSISSAGVLTSAAGGVAGKANGGLYALTVSASDTTNGSAASPAKTVNVVVGSSGGDTVSLASISGITKAAPTFVYGLAGNDTISASNMSGTVYFDGGAGADTMTGGSGTNIYEYGATTDSTASLMDIITNFKVAVDRIDLTGIGTSLSVGGALSSNTTSIAAHTIDWAVSGSNTFVYVNTSSSSESLTAANMKIELQGKLSLNSADFLHT